MRIYLIGYMASGKSLFGRLLAQRIKYPFTDLDQLFEERFRISVSDFFGKYDESAFRLIEKNLLHKASDAGRMVISTGGGTPCFHDNMQYILEKGLSVYLKWQVETLTDRLSKTRKKRPLIMNTPADQLKQQISSHLVLREKFYSQANIILQADEYSTDDLIDQMVIRIGELSPQFQQ